LARGVGEVLGRGDLGCRPRGGGSGRLGLGLRGCGGVPRVCKMGEHAGLPGGIRAAGVCVWG
jgi:hypothetical protein